MKFGLFYELQIPKALDHEHWDPAAERRAFNEMLDQVELADRVGFDYVFEVEHHFLEEYSHSSAPDLMLSALSQRTKNIRLGHGIALTPPPYSHPARVAERISTLDILSNGRVEFGSGESASHMELAGFGVTPGLKKAMWEEATREITRMMSLTPYPGYQGEFFSMPERNVVPKPVQRPHPPLWVAALRRETTMVAGRLGMGSLGFGFETPAELGERIHEYYRLMREECTPLGQAINPAIGVLSSFMIADSDEEAVRRSADGPGFFSFSLNYYYNPVSGTKHPAGRAHLFRRFSESAQAQETRRGPLEESELRRTEPTDEMRRALHRAANSAGGIGTIERVRQRLKSYEEQNLDLLIFVAQAGNRKHEHIMESIERFGKELLPEFKERHERRHARWRAEQLAGVEWVVNSSI